jgi:hypothetical protein
MMRGRPQLGIAVLLAALGAFWYLNEGDSQGTDRAESNATASGPGDPAWQAFHAHANGQAITVPGIVERILEDDRDGSPHQRFIIRTPQDLRLLVAHNLDLAPRLEGLTKGDSVIVRGDYEWNEKGGVMHWTHGDPRGQHAAGYIEWRGKRYQ